MRQFQQQASVLKRTLEARDAMTVYLRASEYLAKAGYVKTSDSPMTFSRGHRALTPVAFGPRGWNADITVVSEYRDEEHTGVTVVMIVDTTGQILTRSEKLFFLTELQELETAIRENRIPSLGSRRIARRAFWENVFIGLLVFALPLGCVMLSIGLGEELGFDANPWAIVFILGGAAVGVGLLFFIALFGFGHFTDRSDFK